MARWTIAIQLAPRTDGPLFRQIVSAIVADIRRGRLRPGDRLPGTRTIARALGVNRQTVVVALDELVAEGWLEAVPARGTFISRRLPDSAASRSRSTRRPLRPLRPPFAVPDPPPGAMPYNVPPGGLLLAPNRPDVRLLPHTLIGRAYARAIRDSGQHLLGYGRPQGHQPLRAAIAAMLSATRGVAVTADDLCLTHGSQMAIALLARTLVRPGDLVVVEELCHQPAVEAFRVSGAEIASVSLDAEGLDVDAVERLARSRRVRAVYLTPHHQFPTAVTLSPPRRLKLLALAQAHRFAIIEEDYDHEFHFDGRPVLPLASLDSTGVVAYVGTFSKVLAPGLRIGYIAAPRTLVAATAAHRLHLDVQGDRVLEHALASLIAGGDVQRHIRRVHREYAARRDVFIDALRRTLGSALTFTVPSGGIAIWARAAQDLDIDVWAARAHRRGVVIETARHYAVDRRPRPFTRLGFASRNRRELVEAVRRLADARPGIRNRARATTGRQNDPG
jgi:GntR family transcriptional regulator / MocR family aminotransferase